jgi:hypothetical protein
MQYKKLKCFFLYSWKCTANNTVYIVYSVMGGTTSSPDVHDDTGMEFDNLAANRKAKLAAAERAAAERAATERAAAERAAAERAATERAAAKVANNLAIMQTDATSAKQRSRTFADESATAACIANEKAIANPTSTAAATEAANAKSLADAARIFADNVEFLSNQYILSLRLFSLSLDNIADAREAYLFNLGVCCRNLNKDTKSLKVRQTWGVTMRHNAPMDDDAAAKRLVKEQGN